MRLAITIAVSLSAASNSLAQSVSYRLKRRFPIRHETLIRRLPRPMSSSSAPPPRPPRRGNQRDARHLPEAAGPGSALTVTAGDVEEGAPGIVREGASGTMASPFWSSGFRPSRAKGHPRHDRGRVARPDSRWKRLRVSATAIGWGNTSIREFPADRGCRSGSEAVD